MASGAVKLGDLNDFINPAQACVVALSGAFESEAYPHSRMAGGILSFMCHTSLD